MRKNACLLILLTSVLCYKQVYKQEEEAAMMAISRVAEGTTLVKLVVSMVCSQA